jgi:hypothetical protein
MTIPKQAVDLTNRRFGRLAVLRYTPERKDGKVVWECMCDCGTPVKAASAHLISGTVRSCGCVRSEARRELKAGEQFGRLTVVSYAGESHWSCLCLCGKTTRVLASNLRSGKQRSCGCYRASHNRTHGMSQTSIYRRWNAMLLRCEDSSHPSYHHYAGRGIRVCARWHRFEDFYADVGDPPPRMSLDRIDVNRGYEPGNVRWASGSTQAKNKRSHKEVVIESLSIVEVEAILAAKRTAHLGVFA